MGGHERLADYLQTEGVEFTVRQHTEAYTAQEVAAADHIPGHLFLKVVMVFADESLVMLCMPAPHDVDFEMAKAALGAGEVRLANEQEFAPRFPDCDVGAMPPFGNLYDCPVYVEESLTRDDRIVFNACNHEQSVEIQYSDWERLVRPTVAKFAREG
jgi:Ala-tRNA(Pro) deacylase